MIPMNSARSARSQSDDSGLRGGSNDEIGYGRGLRDAQPLILEGYGFGSVGVSKM
jgi:hypothetical protein